MYRYLEASELNHDSMFEISSHFVVPVPHVVEVDKAGVSGCDNTYYSPSEILMLSKVSQQSDLSQGTLRQDGLVKHAGNALDGNRLAA
jgi:hypothetical protein